MEEPRPPAPPPEPPRGVLWRLQGIFFEPKETFRALRPEPNWLAPVLASVLVSLGTTLVIYSVVDPNQPIRAQIEQSPQGSQMSQEQLDEAVQAFAQSPLAPILKYAGPLLSPIVVVLATAGMLTLLIYLLGSELPFLRTLSVVAHTSFFYYTVMAAMTVAVFLLSPNPESINLNNPVSSNPGMLVDPRESPVLFRLLSSLDLIVFYDLYLMALGISTLAERISLKAGLAMAFLLYGLYVGIAAGFAAIFS